MMPSAETVVGQVIDVLAGQVLPGLPAATWDAANIRAAITLLTYAQDAIAVGPGAADAASGAMRALFAVAQDLGEDVLDGPLRQQLSAARDTATTGVAAYEANKAVLAALVVQSAGKRPAGFHAVLREVIQQVNEADFVALGRASTLPPF